MRRHPHGPSHRFCIFCRPSDKSSGPFNGERAAEAEKLEHNRFHCDGSTCVRSPVSPDGGVGLKAALAPGEFASDHFKSPGLLNSMDELATPRMESIVAGLFGIDLNSSMRFRPLSLNRQRYPTNGLFPSH